MTEAAEVIKQEPAEPVEPVEPTEPLAEPEELPEGFQSREQWEESGKNPDDWRSPKTFADFNNLTEANKRLHQKVDHLTQTFETRLQGVNTMHQAQLQTQANKLNIQKTEAIESADSEKVQQIDKELNSNYQQQQQLSQPQRDHLNSIATYFNQAESDLVAKYPAKAIDIRDKMSGLLNRHTDPNAAADEFEAFAKTLAPTSNPRRNEKGKVESSSSRAKGKLSMTDVTADEKAQRQWFPSDKAFLQAVQDVRGEKK